MAPLRAALTRSVSERSGGRGPHTPASVTSRAPLQTCIFNAYTIIINARAMLEETSAFWIRKLERGRQVAAGRLSSGRVRFWGSEARRSKEARAPGPGGCDTVPCHASFPPRTPRRISIMAA